MRHGRVNRPNKGACERERVRQWIAGDIGNRFLHVKVFTADAIATPTVATIAPGSASETEPRLCDTAAVISTSSVGHK